MSDAEIITMREREIRWLREALQSVMETAALRADTEETLQIITSIAANALRRAVI